ncbi:MAG: exodeoxyribonuclease VII small subunit [Prevotella sp.]|nr:exodeoxyribonuclease VII small subunit [Prevotella sp.]
MKNYNEALQELEDIAQRMERGDYDIETMKNDVEKAKKLIKFCRQRLTKTEEEINAIVSEDSD